MDRLRTKGKNKDRSRSPAESVQCSTKTIGRPPTFVDLSINWPRVPNHVVKSAGRTLQILEYFDDRQCPANVVEISKTLRYPQSSVSILLRSLALLGYLSYDGRQRTYCPTYRVRLLGSWINPALFGEGKLLNLVAELNSKTRHAVWLATINDLHVVYLHVMQAKTSLRLHLTPGTLRPLGISVAGHVLLSKLPDVEVQKIIMRINAERAPGEDIIRPAEIVASLRQIHTKGYAFAASKINLGAAVIAMLLPEELSPTPLAICIGGANSTLAPQVEKLARVMKDYIDRFRKIQCT